MSNKLRLVAFNILEGLRPVKPVDDERRMVDRDRAGAVLSVIDELKPDFLVLNEALYCRLYTGKKVDYGKLLGFPYETSSLYDNEWGNAILSRHPIAKSSEMRIYNRGGMIAEIETPEGAVTITSYHPHPGRYPENKAEDFTALVEGQTGPLIICGDFNSISPDDPIDRPQMIKAFQAFSDNGEATLDQFLESGGKVFGALRKLGFDDAIPPAGRRYSIPTDLLSLDKASAMRVDHILVNKEVKVISGEVVQSDATNQASDHHPVMIDFSLI